MVTEKFLDYMRYELNRAPVTVQKYGIDLRKFETWFQGLEGGITWETVDADIVRCWMEAQMEKGEKPSSVCRHLSALKSFYRYALAHGFVSKDPTHLIAGPKKERPLPQFVREDQMNAVFDDSQWGTDYKDVLARTILITLYETGIRRAELMGLRDKDIDFDQRQLKVTGKRNKQRLIPFGDELEKTLRGYMALRDHDIEKKSDVFFLTPKGRPLSETGLWKIVTTNLSRFCTLKKCSPHVLRHTFATAMLNHGASLESLRKLLGHTSVSTTEIYTHTTFEQLKRVYNHAHPRA